MSYPEYDGLAIADLQAEFVRLADVFADASDRRQALLELIAQRQASASAAARVADMSQIDKDALMTALTAAEPMEVLRS